jgi:hypothetical protein
VINTLIFLLAAHALADYPLQGDFLANAKNRMKPIPGVPWRQALGAHALIHAGLVTLITGYWQIGVAEFFIHAYTDDAKCRGRLTFNQDQAIHIACKFIWFFIVIALAKGLLHV